MTHKEFLLLVRDVADTTGYNETDIYDYLWSILRHPIIPASFQRFITGSTREVHPVELNYDYTGKLSQIIKERGHYQP
jgi:hypothetical protein